MKKWALRCLWRNSIVNSARVHDWTPWMRWLLVMPTNLTHAHLLGYHVFEPVESFYLVTAYVFGNFNKAVLITTRNEVGARLYFHRRVWFWSQGGCLVREGAWSRGCMVPGGCIVLGGVWSRAGECMVQGGLVWGVLVETLPGDGYCCGRYASYWNAFLF